MLDKKTAYLLQGLIKLCGDGGYKVIDKKDLILSLYKTNEVDDDALSYMINHLQDRNYIGVKYSDSQVFCLTILPKGRLYKEKSDEMLAQNKKYNRVMFTTMLLSLVTSFLGAFSALILYKIIF